MEGKPKNPEGTVVTEDGCICPAEKVVKKKEKPKQVNYQTCPYDPRFPNTNITKRCYFRWVLPTILLLLLSKLLENFIPPPKKKEKKKKWDTTKLAKLTKLK